MPKPLLKPIPCPFCGRLPEVGPKDPKREGSGGAWVGCENRRCPARPHVTDGAMVCDDRGVEKYKQLAIKRWNKRALRRRTM